MRSRYSLPFFAWLLVLGVSASVWSAPSSKSVQVQFQQDDTSFQVIMRFNAPITPPPVRFYGKQGWVYVDVPAGLVGKAKVQRVRQGGILWARYGWYKARPPITRIWVATSEKRPVQLSQQDDGRTLVLSVWKLGHSPENATRQEAAPTTTPQNAPQPVVQQERPARKPLWARMLPTDSAAPSDQAQAPDAERAEPATSPEPPQMQQPGEPAPAAEPATPSESPQVQQQRAPSPAPEVAQVAQLPEAAPTLPQRPTGRTRLAAAPPRPAPRVTVDFVGAEIADVLKALSLQTQTNIVTSPEVKGTVTVSLAGVTVEEALDLVTRLSGYRYAKVGNTYVVATPQGLQSLLDGTQATTSQPRVTQVVAYRHVNPESLSKVLQERAPGVQVSWNLTSAQPGRGTGTRVALISGTEAEVRATAELIETVDATLSQSQQDLVVDTYVVKHASPSDLRSIVSELVPEVTIILGPRPGFNLLAPAPIGDSAGRTVGEKGIDQALQAGGG
ncbi:MAG: secretin and TonB N-terminal domain-containing protein, partial [Armatimonadetes bacterium]|nr:secretin and TonB N-terminal domain-containing protein [Armatimonadota bacterium]